MRLEHTSSFDHQFGTAASPMSLSSSGKSNRGMFDQHSDCNVQNRVRGVYYEKIWLWLDFPFLYKHMY